MPYNAKPAFLYLNRFAQGTLGASYAASGYPIANAVDGVLYKRWKSTSTGAQYIYTTGVAAHAADTLAIAGHNLGSTGAELSLQWYNGSTWVNTDLLLYSPTADTVIWKQFTSVPSAQGWRLVIGGTPSAPPEIAVLFVGQRLEFPRWLQTGFDPTPEQVRNTASRSEEGHLLSVTQRLHPLTWQLQWRGLQASWVDDTFLPVWRTYLRAGAQFFFCWDATNKADQSAYVRVPDGAQLNAPYTPTYRDLGFTIEGMAE